MEYGVISNISQYSDNQDIKSQQIQPSNETSSTKLNLGNEKNSEKVDDQSLNGVNSSQKKDSEEVSDVKKVDNTDIAKYKEVVLTNLNFGFNDQSKDFYVKAIRGESETQYPTDEMMRIKAYNLAQAKAELESQ